MPKLAVLLPILLFTGCTPSGQSFDTSIITEHTVDLVVPIDSPEEAITYAKKMSFFSQMPKEELISLGYNSFGIFVSKRTPSDDIRFLKTRYKNGLETQDSLKEKSAAYTAIGNYWQIHYFAKGLIPSYSCTLKVSPDGGQVLLRTQCGYNK